MSHVSRRETWLMICLSWGAAPLDALRVRIFNLESNFPKGNLTQDFAGLGRSPASPEDGRHRCQGLRRAPSIQTRQEVRPLSGELDQRPPAISGILAALR